MIPPPSPGSRLIIGHYHRRTGHCGVLAIATWVAWFWAAQGRLLTKKKEERKGRKGRFNIFATAGLRTQSAPGHYHANQWSRFQVTVQFRLNNHRLLNRPFPCQQGDKGRFLESSKQWGYIVVWFGYHAPASARECLRPWMILGHAMVLPPPWTNKLNRYWCQKCYRGKGFLHVHGVCRIPCYWSAEWWNEIKSRGGGGGHLYFRLDIVLVKDFQNHTINTYFSGMKIDPKYAFLHSFFLFCPLSFPKFVTHDQKHTVFSNFACFCTPKRCTCVHCLVLKHNPNYVNFFTLMISNFKYKWPPRG